MAASSGNLLGGSPAGIVNVQVGAGLILTGGTLSATASLGSLGISELTGDVLAGPGSGSQIATLEDTAVTPGSYTYASLTVDAKGRLTAAASGAAPVSAANPTAQVSGSAVNGVAVTYMRSDGAPALANTAVVAGIYTYSSIAVDAQGRLTAAASGAAPPSGANPTASVSGSAVNGAASTFMRSDAAPALGATAVTPGSYTLASLTVDAQGRLTAASSGSAGSGTVTSVAMTVPAELSVAGSPITTAGTLAVTWATQTANMVFASAVSGGAAAPAFRALIAADLPATAVTPGSYTNTSLTVDAQGRLTAAATPAAPAFTSSSPANPTGTTSTVGVMMGLAGTITPAVSGTVMIIVSGGMNNNTASRGAFTGIRYGTGSAPANGAAATGTLLLGGVFHNNAAANLTVPWTVVGIATGLAVGTPYWIDIWLGAVTSGTAAVFGLGIQAVEHR